LARITVADDDPGLLEFVTRVLVARGHQVSAYKDGREALDAILAAQPDARAELVVSDVQMPRLDGIGLCKELRLRWSKAELPLVLVSVLEAEDDILRGFEAGANDYLVKPYRGPQLTAKVQVLLQERELLTPRARDDLPTLGRLKPDILPEDIVPPFLLDKYEAVAILGQGGMGTVYRAHERGSEKAIALKLLAPIVAQDRAGLARFFREAATLARVDSPHVVRALDSGMDQGRYFLAMELVPGVSAKTRLVGQGPYPPRDAAELGRDVALALAALAEKGLVHRDLKPSNIIVGRDGRATLVDFGLARGREDQDLTGTGEAIGTPHYIAPEVLRGQQSDIRSDLYSLGATLFELLTGRKPYSGATAFDVFHALFSGPRADVKEARPEVPQSLAAIVNALLEIDPALRADSPAAVAAQLEAIIAGL
jgi:CheY-like chemotaxis protein